MTWTDYDYFQYNVIGYAVCSYACEYFVEIPQIICIATWFRGSGEFKSRCQCVKRRIHLGMKVILRILTTVNLC